jgi:hypothetical protein
MNKDCTRGLKIVINMDLLASSLLKYRAKFGMIFSNFLHTELIATLYLLCCKDVRIYVFRSTHEQG